MTETTVVSGLSETAPASSGNPSSKKKTSNASKKKVAKTAKPAHPPTSTMVNSAIAALKERGGSSLQAIKKYIGANYEVETEKLAPFIRKYLKSAVASGTLTQTKGAGASGSFKLKAPGDSKPSATPSVRKKQSGKTKAGPKTPKTKIAGSPTKVKKPQPKKKTGSGTPSKSKKTKAPPTKPKTPKAKKVGSTSSSTSSKKKPASSPKRKVTAKRAPKRN